MKNTLTPKTREVIKNLGLLTVSLLFSFLLVEVFLRVLPPSISGITIGAEYQKNEKIAYTLKPSSTQEVVSSCFRSSVSSNSLGFRGQEWGNLGGIAVLGDSYTEALQVSDEETFSARLADSLAVPVYNAGLSSFGTVAELLTYREYVREYKPEIVILAMFENDITDNHCGISTVGGAFVTKPCATIENESMIINRNYYSIQGNTKIRSIMKKHCISCSIFRSFIVRLRDKATNIQGATDQKQDNLLEEESWEITRIALNELKKATEEESATLVVMAIPDLTAYYEQGAEESVSTRIVMLAEENNLHVLDLRPLFAEYIDRFTLPKPFFSYPCDGHWNPLGHHLASQFLVKYLLENDLLVVTEGKSREEILDTAKKSLGKTPEEILGSERFERIYLQDKP